MKQCSLLEVKEDGANKVGLGCWAFGQDLWQQEISNSIKTIHHALSRVRFDTAQGYGKENRSKF